MIDDTITMINFLNRKQQKECKSLNGENKN